MNMSERPLILEIVGVAGAGKSTLTQALGRLDGLFTPGLLLRTRSWKRAPYVIRHVLALVPVLLARPRAAMQLPWTEVKLMLYLNGWHAVVRRPMTRGCRVVVLDQGPIYSLARLGTTGSAVTRSPCFEEWTRNVLEDWARVLDFLIWLDAPDSVLWERIHKREQSHYVRGRSSQEGYPYLHAYRREYERYVSKLTDGTQVGLLRFDTSRLSPLDLVDEVVQALEIDPRPASTSRKEFGAR